MLLHMAGFSFLRLNNITFYICVYVYIYYVGFPGSASGKEPDMPTNTGNIRDMVHFLGWEDPMEKSMAKHSDILAWRIPWTEGSIGLQSMGLQRVGHN